jgi:hypothetical protein
VVSKIPLEPFTGYLLDVEMVDVGAPADARGPRVYRRSFTTGGFATFEAFAAAIQAARPTSRHCPTGLFATLLAQFPADHPPLGAELDMLLIGHGIEPLPPAGQPRVVVFWETAAGLRPQPAALMIDAPEALWRRRPYPAATSDDTGPETVVRWTLEDFEWLGLNDASAAESPVERIVRAPGWQRAFIVFKPQQRGRVVMIELAERVPPALSFLDQTKRSAVLVELPLDRALWED